MRFSARFLSGFEHSGNTGQNVPPPKKKKKTEQVPYTYEYNNNFLILWQTVGDIFKRDRTEGKKM